MARDDFPEDVKRRLKDRVGSICSKPDCNKFTSAASDTSDTAVSNIGEAAHICAASEGGARYKKEMTPEERRSITNGIWLCSNCHKIIDSNAVRYTEEILKNWKQQAEQQAMERLGKKIASESGVSQQTIVRLLKNLDEKDVALQGRDKAISEWIEKYKELESRLNSRHDDISKKAKEFLESGQIEKAEELYKQSLEKNLKLAQEAHLQAADDAFSLALIKELEWNTLSAIEYYKQGLQLNPDNFDGWNRLGCLLIRIGETDEAINAYQIVLRLGQEHKNQQEIAVAYGNLGIVYKTRGDLDKAVDCYNKALKINESLGRKKGISIQYSNLGDVYDMCGYFSKAVEYYNKALEISESLGLKEYTANQYNNLGDVYRIDGNLDKAVQYYKNALSIHASLGHKEGIANDYNNLGIVYKTRGDLNKAVEYYNKALGINNSLGHKEGMAIQYCNLGIVYETKEDYKKVREYWKKSLTLFQTIGSPNAEKVQDALNGLPQEK